MNAYASKRIRCQSIAIHGKMPPVAGGLMKRGSPKAQVSIRFSADIARRVEALRVKLAKDATLSAAGRITATTVAKIAFMRGLDALEREFK